MNKIYLDKLCNFSLTTYKNYEFNNKNIDFYDYINTIKQNQSLNEKGIFLKHNFFELKKLFPNIEYDQMVLINPLCFNLSGNIQWFNFLNSILTILNDNYLYETNLIKKTILETADKTFRKKILIMDKINDDIISQVCNLTNIILIMLTTQHEIKYFNDKNINGRKKILVMINDNNKYFSVLNWKQKYYNSDSEFINYLMNTNDFNKNDNKINNNNPETEFINVVNKKKKKILINDDIINIDDNNQKKIKSTKSTKSTKSIKSTKSSKFSNNIFDYDNTDDDDIDDKFYKNQDVRENENEDVEENQDVEQDKNKINKGTYKELHADENYALYISEIVNDTKKISNKNTKSKKKKKNDKNIFVVNKDDDNKNNTKTNDDKESSIFNKTEKITQKEINEIYNNIKLSMGLESIQSHALKLGISIFEGTTKSGKPKNKTKSELIKKIKEYVENYK